ncbi:MAG: hypothetical protein R2710_16405 [Acidimicrobiales bacterium]
MGWLGHEPSGVGDAIAIATLPAMAALAFATEASGVWVATLGDHDGLRDGSAAKPTACITKPARRTDPHARAGQRLVKGATLDLIAEVGFEGTTIELIAERSGMLARPSTDIGRSVRAAPRRLHAERAGATVHR